MIPLSTSPSAPVGDRPMSYLLLSFHLVPGNYVTGSRIRITLGESGHELGIA